MTVDRLGKRRSKTRGTLTDRVLRRVAVVLLIATVGLLGGTLATPTLRKHYYLRRLDHAEPAARLEAMNQVAGIAKRDKSAAAPLVKALLAERDRTDGIARDAVERVAVWSIERCDGVHQRVDEFLGAADDSRFALLADWLAQAGRWTPEHREVADLARRAVLGLSAPDPQRRLAALAALEGLGPAAGPFVGEVLPSLLDDPAEPVREAVVAAASVCLDSTTAVGTVLLPALADQAGAVRRAAVISLGMVKPSALADRVHRGLTDRDESVLEALLWSLRQTPAGGDLALAAASHSATPVRRMAAYSLGFAPIPEAAAVETLNGLRKDPDLLVAARSLIALGRRGVELDDLSALIESTGSDAADVRLAAVYALGRCGAGDRRIAVARLRRMLSEALQAGEVTLAAAVMESLARLGDTPFVPVMLDVVEEFADQPMLQYAAACAARALDADAGADALLEMCGAESDEVRELAAFRISRLAAPPVERLCWALDVGGDPLRGGAALALACSGTCRAAPDQPLAPWLRARLDPSNPLFEPSWQVRANYLCAALICGEEDARRDLDGYLLNANVSRMGLYVALLETGETSPLDLLLAEPAAVDPMSFIRAARFAEVLAHYFPQAPGLLWVEDAEMCRFQTQRLRDWWRVLRFRVRFDENLRVFVGPRARR